MGDVAAPPLLLIHGFGANAFHWRANVNALALTNRVYAIDLIGFGGTDKPVIEYDADLWVEQCAAFLRTRGRVLCSYEKTFPSAVPSKREESHRDICTLQARWRGAVRMCARWLRATCVCGAGVKYVIPSSLAISDVPMLEIAK